MGTASTKTRVFFRVLKGVLQLLLNIIFYVLVVLAVMELSKAAYNFSYQIFGNVVVEEAPGTEVKVEIQQGESTSSVARKLAVKRIAVNEYSFYLRAKFTTGSDKPILPGEYVLNTSMNYDEILEVITDAEAGQKEESGE